MWAEKQVSYVFCIYLITEVPSGLEALSEGQNCTQQNCRSEFLKYLKIRISIILQLMSQILFPPVRHLDYLCCAILQVCVCNADIGLGKSILELLITSNRGLRDLWCNQSMHQYSNSCAQDTGFPFTTCCWITHCLDPQQPLCLSKISITPPEINHATQTVMFL